MLDYRIYTFLSLCDTLSYTKTALELKMTQPGVTQHIHLLEKEYGCQLFKYTGKVLSLTGEGLSLERHLRSAVLVEREQKLKLSSPQTLPLKIGATKTIGDFVIDKAICALTRKPEYDFTLVVDNTDVLLKKLGRLEINMALIEGLFDKSKYEYRLLRKEPFVGLCSKKHPFAGKEIPMEELFLEHLILREVGSGTRSIFEGVLHSHNFTVDSFKSESCISSFHAINLLVKKGIGISFAYKSIADADKGLQTFKIKGEDIFGEFNYVYLPLNDENPWFLKVFESAM